MPRRVPGGRQRRARRSRRRHPLGRRRRSRPSSPGRGRQAGRALHRPRRCAHLGGHRLRARRLPASGPSPPRGGGGRHRRAPPGGGAAPRGRSGPVRRPTDARCRGSGPPRTRPRLGACPTSADRSRSTISPPGRGMSRRHFTRRFAEVVGTTPARWVQARRLDEARRLLETTTWPITRIAQVCGFNGAVTFRQNFVAAYSTTPTSYRQRFATSAVVED